MEEANGRERGGREGYLFGWGMGNDITWVPGPTTWVLARVGGVDREFRNSRLTVESALRANVGGGLFLLKYITIS